LIGPRVDGSVRGFIPLLLVAACSRPPPSAPVTLDVDAGNSPTPKAAPKADLAVETDARVTDGAPARESYDLAADVSRRVALAKTDLGPRATVMVDSDLFVLAGASGWGPGALARSVGLARGALAALYNGRFSTKPTHAISIYLFPAADPYERFCRKVSGEACMSPFGFYEPDERRITMNAGPGLGTLTHELVHPLLETDFPEAPTWINEGIASLFEAPVLPRPGEIHGTKNWRLPRLTEGLSSPAERTEARLEHLFGMSDATFRDEREKLHYATARYTCQWLDSKEWLWPFYRRWRDRVAEDPTGEKSFEAVVGRSPRDASDDWVRWVRSLGRL
jgi:hypothetical protein